MVKDIGVTLTEVFEDSTQFVDGDVDTSGSTDFDIMTPVVGQVFQDTKNLYFTYAIKMGFPIRKGTIKVRDRKMI